MRKVIVIGCPGAGKSTFARALRDVTNLPLYYLDMIWHKPDKSNITSEEFDARLHQIILSDEWIIDGNYLRTMEMRLAACDTVFLLDFPQEVCLVGARSRVGIPREDMPWVETEFDEEFRQHITDFSREQRPKIGALLENYRKNRTVYQFKSRTESDQYLKGIRDEKLKKTMKKP